MQTQVWRCLRRIIERNYRVTVSNACYAHATRGGGEAKDIVVVADAGMLSAANLLALVWRRPGSASSWARKRAKAPYDLADHLERHGDAFEDGQSS